MQCWHICAVGGGRSISVECIIATDKVLFFFNIMTFFLFCGEFSYFSMKTYVVCN